MTHFTHSSRHGGVNWITSSSGVGCINSKNSASPSGDYERGRSCPTASEIEARLSITAQTKTDEPTQARTNAELALKTQVEGCGRPHTPTTAEVHRGEPLPFKISGGPEDHDRPDVEAASHRDVVVSDWTARTFFLESKETSKRSTNRATN